MAGAIDREELLKFKYPSYTIEVKTFLDTAHISKCTDVSIEKIYAAIKNDPQVNENLKLLYYEAIHGSNKDVKTRIRNRVTNFCRSLK